ncbi:hypothetical protein PQR67_03435 [Paraburkholderia fungorum]|uniref:hypothetical protein n=1 Tax=Paraburkholderia fungorum TaxID=134537 RepID=UPI0038BC7109
MINKPELVQRAHAELCAAAGGFERAGAVFRAVFTALIQGDGCSSPDVLSLVQVGSALCDTYAGRADDEGGYFEDLLFSSRERPAEDSSQGTAEGGSA